MSFTALEMAEKYLKRRKFNKVIEILEKNRDLYEDSFEYYLTLGIAALYAGVPGTAAGYFDRARQIRQKNTRLLLGQAAIFLRRGETDRPIEYYLNVLELDPQNEIARKALEFIRVNGDPNTLNEMCMTGAVEKFYPPLGVNPDAVRNCVFAGIFLGLAVSLGIILAPMKKNAPVQRQPEIAGEFSLSEDEMQNPLENDLTGSVVNYVFSPKEATQCFQDAKKYFKDGRDNLCRVELNRILESNAVTSMKQKAAEMEVLLKEPTFGTLKDNFSYRQVAENPGLFQNCFVSWEGQIANSRKNPDGSWQCNLLVNYVPSRNKTSVEGMIPVRFDVEPHPPVVGEKPVTFLAKICIDGDSIRLEGRAVYQELKGSSAKK